jgi:hypothetical protein
MGQANGDPDTGAKLWQYGVGPTDDEQLLDVLAESNFLPADGEAEEYVFYKAFLTLTWSMAVHLQLVAEVDQEAMPDTEGAYTFDVLVAPILLTQPSGDRRTKTFEIPFVLKLSLASVEQSRTSVRGTRIRCRLQSVGGLGDGFLAVDGFRLELEAVQETIATQAP